MTTCEKPCSPSDKKRVDVDLSTNVSHTWVKFPPSAKGEVLTSVSLFLPPKTEETNMGPGTQITVNMDNRNMTHAFSRTTTCPEFTIPPTQLAISTHHNITILDLKKNVDLKGSFFCIEYSTTPVVKPTMSNTTTSNTSNTQNPDEPESSGGPMGTTLSDTVGVTPKIVSPWALPIASTPSTLAPLPTVHQIQPTPPPKNAHKGAIAGGVLGGIVFIIIVLLLWRRCRKPRVIPILDKEKAVERRNTRRSSLWSLVPTSPTPTMLAEAANFDPTRMVKTGSPFDKSAYLTNSHVGGLHLTIPSNNIL